MAFRRKKTKRLPWRVGPPTSEALAKEKADAGGKPNSSPAPIKRPTIADIMVTKKEAR